MEIQDLNSETKYHKPILLPDRQFTHMPQESDIFRTAEGIIELSLSQQTEGEEEPDTPDTFENYSPLLPVNEDREHLSIEDLRKAFGENSAELSSRLRQFFSSKGIQAPIAANMSVDSQGRVVVSGDEAQKAALETEFADNPDLSAILADISSAAPVLRAADVARDFAKAYERNPPAALSEYPHLFSEKFKFNTRFENDNLRASFNSNSGQSIEWWPGT